MQVKAILARSLGKPCEARDRAPRITSMPVKALLQPWNERLGFQTSRHQAKPEVKHSKPFTRLATMSAE